MAAPANRFNKHPSLAYQTSSVENIRKSVKTDLANEQKKHREQVITLKRLKIDTTESVSSTLLTSHEENLEKLSESVKQLKHGKKLDALLALHRLFSKAADFGEEFIKCGGLQPLMSCLASTNSEVLHAAAWCAVNLTAGSSPSIHKSICLSPLLSQYLKTSDPVMQELCAWALGNLAGDSPKLCLTLLKQGCIPDLAELMSTEYHLSFSLRTQSTIFALTNLARGSVDCVRCMQSNCIFEHIKLMLRSFSSSCDFMFELGWLINYIYSRPEVFKEQRSQCSEILLLIVQKISHILTESWESSEKVLIPYLHCVGNLLLRCPTLCVEASEMEALISTLCLLLQSDTVSLQQEALWILSNFFVEPSCCVLTMCQPKVYSLIIHLCQSLDNRLAKDALYLIDATSHVSVYMCQYLISNGILVILTGLLTSLDSTVIDKALDVSTHLLTMTQQTDVKTGLLASRLQSMLSWKLPELTQQKAKHLHQLCLNS